MLHHDRRGRIIAWVASALVILNLVALDIWIIRQTKNFSLPLIASQTITAPAKKEATQMSSQSCTTGCIELIRQATASLELATPTSAPAKPATTVSTGSREFFVPIGSGTTTKDDWDDLNGLQVWIDKSQYGPIKQAVFEASVRVPTKNQWVDVRLYNVTDKHPVWFSEVRFPGGSDPTLVVSDPIVLDEGKKLYKVQMKTQLKHDAFLDASRIHITTY